MVRRSVRLAEKGAAHRTPDTPFRFLDLPAEIRNRIYSFSLATRPSRDLSYSRIPILVLVSRQVRKEALPILFAETNYQINVGSEVWRSGFVPRKFSDVMRRPEYCELDGMIDFFSVVEKFLENAGDKAALFRNVTFRLYQSVFVSMFREDLRDLAGTRQEGEIHWKPFALVHLRVVAGNKLELSIEEGQDHPRQGPSPSDTVVFYPEEAEIVTKKAKLKAEAVASRDGFRGFTLDELKEVAWELRSAWDDV